MPRQGAGENNRAQRDRESVFPPDRPQSAGSGECGALAASAGGGGFGAGNDIAAVRRSGAGDIFRYQLLSENIRARIPRMPWQGAGENNRAQRNRESVFPPARPHSAGSGECAAALAAGGALVRGVRVYVGEEFQSQRKTSGPRPCEDKTQRRPHDESQDQDKAPFRHYPP